MVDYTVLATTGLVAIEEASFPDKYILGLLAVNLIEWVVDRIVSTPVNQNKLLGK